MELDELKPVQRSMYWTALLSHRPTNQDTCALNLATATTMDIEEALPTPPDSSTYKDGRFTVYVVENKVFLGTLTICIFAEYVLCVVLMYVIICHLQISDTFFFFQTKVSLYSDNKDKKIFVTV